MKQSESIKQITTALNKLQADMNPASQNKTNPHFKSRYADLVSVWEAVRGPLTENGLSVVQDACTEDDKIVVKTCVYHTSGEWIACGPLNIPTGKPSPHAVGSAISYGKRYALAAALGIVAEPEDDGNAANESYSKTQRKITKDMAEIVNKWINGDEDLRQAVHKSAGVRDINDINTSQLEAILVMIYKQQMLKKESANAKS